MAILTFSYCLISEISWGFPTSPRGEGRFFPEHARHGRLACLEFQVQVCAHLLSVLLWKVAVSNALESWPSLVSDIFYQTKTWSTQSSSLFEIWESAETSISEHCPHGFIKNRSEMSTPKDCLSQRKSPITHGYGPISPTDLCSKSSYSFTSIFFQRSKSPILWLFESSMHRSFISDTMKWEGYLDDKIGQCLCEQLTFHIFVFCPFYIQILAKQHQPYVRTWEYW